MESKRSFLIFSEQPRTLIYSDRHRQFVLHCTALHCMALRFTQRIVFETKQAVCRKILLVYSKIHRGRKTIQHSITHYGWLEGGEGHGAKTPRRLSELFRRPRKWKWFLRGGIHIDNNGTTPSYDEEGSLIAARPPQDESEENKFFFSSERESICHSHPHNCTRRAYVSQNPYSSICNLYYPYHFGFGGCCHDTFIVLICSFSASSLSALEPFSAQYFHPREHARFGEWFIIFSCSL